MIRVKKHHFFIAAILWIIALVIANYSYSVYNFDSENNDAAISVDDIRPDIIEALGGEEAFERLPILDAQGINYNLKRITPKIMSAAIMKGIIVARNYKIPFISFKYREVIHNSERVETVYADLDGSWYVINNVGTLFGSEDRSELSEDGVSRIADFVSGNILEPYGANEENYLGSYCKADVVITDEQKNQIIARENS